MTLRSRLILALAGSGLAILLGSFVAREIAIRYASEASIHSSIEARLSSLDRETCESGRDFDRREFRPRRPDDPNGPARARLRSESRSSGADRRPKASCVSGNASARPSVLDSARVRSAVRA